MEREDTQKDARDKGKEKAADGARSSSSNAGDRNDSEQTQAFEEEEPEEKPKEEPDSDDFADVLVYWKNNPNVTVFQGRWGQIKKMRHNTCIGRYLSHPQGTMHNGYYVEI